MSKSDTEETIADVTERQRLEEPVLHVQKMEATVLLAGRVAHDLNNLLTAINGYSSLALQRTDTDDAIRGYLEEIRKAGDRAADLTKQLLACSIQAKDETRCVTFVDADARKVLPIDPGEVRKTSMG